MALVPATDGGEAIVREWLRPLPVVDGVHRLPGADSRMEFARLYAEVRRAEGRALSDARLARLPRTDADDPLAGEWAIRAASLRMLLRHLGQRRGHRPHAILDVGCGNGWMSAHLAGLPGALVVGLDAVHEELAQAARAFPRVAFVQGDATSDALPGGAFDAVVMAASLQYLPDAAGAVRRLLPCLTDGGALHVLDTPLYREGEREAARERTLEHYGRMGVPGMAVHYHHHLLADLLPLASRVLYDPRAPGPRLKAALTGRPGPTFPWLVFGR